MSNDNTNEFYIVFKIFLDHNSIVANNLNYSCFENLPGTVSIIWSIEIIY